MKKGKEKIINPIVSFVKKYRKIVLGGLIFIMAIFLIYIGMAIYFMNHFYFGTTINCISVSGKSVGTVNEIMEEELQEYTIILKERGGKEEKIKSDEIGLVYESGKDFEDSKYTQNAFKWISSLFNKEDLHMTEVVKFDEKLLEKRVDELACFDSNNIIEPEDPTFNYRNERYEIVPEIDGNKVNRDILQEHVEEALLKRQTSIDLEAIDCYYKPEYTSESKMVITTNNLLNKYVSSKITYTVAGKEEILNGNTINKWITIDENMKISLDVDEVANYVQVLANNYNTVAKQRNFVTTYGAKIKVGGGDYGWIINKEEEAQVLIKSIKMGEVVSKEPAYLQTAMSHNVNDIGNTYVEISLSGQYLWFYKNGSIIAEGPIVTGNVSAGHTTPSGIYKLKFKQKDAVLRGDDYACPVSFWMPFNGGIGMHDANWRGAFGGSIYRTNGSHGCVNCPYSLAKSLYYNIEAGTPIVCYN